jgi:aspartokinase-like uncharacterized kinase
MFNALIKVGGSLYNQPQLRANLAVWANLARGQRLLFLPGGGPFAGQVRTADVQLKLSDEAAHWMAILAMDQYAYLLADLMPGAKVVRDLSAAEFTTAAGQAAILAPSTLLLKLDPLPHSWQITSDSIAAWLAKHAGIPLLVLLKSVAGVYQLDGPGRSTTLLRQVTKPALARLDLVDSCFTETLAPETTCWIIDGGQPRRLAELLLDGCTQGTQVV